MVKLGEVGTFTRGGGFLKRDYVEDGYPCMHYGQIHMKLGVATTEHLSMIPHSLAIKSKIATKGDVIIAITSEDVEGSCKSTAWMGEYDIAIGAHTAIFKHNQNSLFLSYYFQSPQFNTLKRKYTRGFKVVEIKPSDIEKIEIPLPPLEEQHRIVSILDASFEKIDALKQNAEDNLKNAKALFQQVLTQELKPKDGWVEKKLGEVATFSQGVQVPLPEQSLIEQEGYSRFLRIIDYTQGNESPRYTLINDSKYKMFKDDIAIVRYGASTGFICMGIEGILANNLFKININDYHFIYTYYLSYVLKSEIFQGKIKEQMNGAAMPAISFGMIKNILLPFPINIEEQHRIVHTLDTLSEKCRRLEQVAQQTIRECDALKQSILRQAFSGEL